MDDATEKCPACEVLVKDDDKAVLCDVGRTCQDITEALYAILTWDDNESTNWYCKYCKRGVKNMMAMITQLNKKQTVLDKRVTPIENKVKTQENKEKQKEDSLTK